MMRRKNSVISFAIAIVVSVALSACGQKSDVGSNLGVRIIEGQAFARSGLPLAGLLVVVDGNQTTADANGRFRQRIRASVRGCPHRGPGLQQCRCVGVPGHSHSEPGICLGKDFWQRHESDRNR